MKQANKKSTEPAQENPRMPLTRRNYIILAVGFAVILLGFILMAGGGAAHAHRVSYSLCSLGAGPPSPPP